MLKTKPVEIVPPPEKVQEAIDKVAARVVIRSLQQAKQKELLAARKVGN